MKTTCIINIQVTYGNYRKLNVAKCSLSTHLHITTTKGGDGVAKKTLISTNCLKRMQLLNQLRDDLRDAITADCISAYTPEHLEPYKELDQKLSRQKQNS